MTARFTLPHFATTDFCLLPANDLNYGTELYRRRKIYTTRLFRSRFARCRSQGTAFLGVLWTRTPDNGRRCLLSRTPKTTKVSDAQQAFKRPILSGL